MSDSVPSVEHDSTELRGLGLAALKSSECVNLLEKTPVGRVVFLSEGYPVALPVNYRWFEGSVVFRTLLGQKLNAAVANQLISFEIDGWDVETHTGWSVLVKGRGREVDGWAEQEQLEQLGLVPWADGDWKVSWIRLEPDAIEGRSLL